MGTDQTAEGIDMQEMLITLNTGEQSRIQKAVSEQLSLVVRQMMLAYTANTLTPERAYAGIAACAALHSILHKLDQPVHEAGPIREKAFNGRV